MALEMWGGALDRPYTEDDAPNPLNVYGASKAEAERRIATVMPEALIVRTSAFEALAAFASRSERHIEAGRPGVPGQTVPTAA